MTELEHFTECFLGGKGLFGEIDRQVTLTVGSIATVGILPASQPSSLHRHYFPAIASLVPEMHRGAPDPANELPDPNRAHDSFPSTSRPSYDNADDALLIGALTSLDRTSNSCCLLMFASQTGSRDGLPEWYTPRRILLLFTCLQLLVFMDRGVRVPPGICSYISA